MKKLVLFKTLGLLVSNLVVILIGVSDAKAVTFSGVKVGDIWKYNLKYEGSDEDVQQNDEIFLELVSSPLGKPITPDTLSKASDAPYGEWQVSSIGRWKANKTGLPFWECSWGCNYSGFELLSPGNTNNPNTVWTYFSGGKTIAKGRTNAPYLPLSGTSVPEPLTILGSTTALGIGIILKKRQKQTV